MLDHEITARQSLIDERDNAEIIARYQRAYGSLSKPMSHSEHVRLLERNGLIQAWRSQ